MAVGLSSDILIRPIYLCTFCVLNIVSISYAFVSRQYSQLTLLFLFSYPGDAGYKLCYQEVLKVVKGIIHQPYELEDANVFYAFSYYFDRAVDAGLIG